MIDYKYLELMNKQIDNIISPEEEKQLEKYLSDNEEARNYYNDLVLTDRYVDDLHLPEPDDNLKKRIVNSINFGKYLPKQKKKFSWSYFLSPKLKPAYIFVIGLIFGILAYSLLIDNTFNLNNNDISGTIGAESVELKNIENLHMNFYGIKGNIALYNSGKNYSLSIKINSEELSDLEFSYPNNVHFRNLIPLSDGNYRFSKAKNKITTYNSGSGQYRLNFTLTSKKSSEINLSIKKSGSTVYSHIFSISNN